MKENRNFFQKNAGSMKAVRQRMRGGGKMRDIDDEYVPELEIECCFPYKE